MPFLWGIRNFESGGVDQMARRIFISYHHKDQMKAKGFNLLRWNKNVDFEFVGRHLLDPVHSENQAYIERCVKEELGGTSVTVVILGDDTHASEWVAREIEWSLAKHHPNGVVGIRLDKDVKVPVDSQVGAALRSAGAEIIDWDLSQFEAAIERACKA